MTLPDLTGLPLEAVVSLAMIFAFADTAVSVVIAIANKNFKADYLADFLRSHVLLRVFPIIALALIGVGIPALSVPAIPEASLAATVALGLYGIEVLGSIKSSGADKSVAPAG